MRERSRFESEMTGLGLIPAGVSALGEVFGNNSLQRVADTTAIPFRWICQVVTTLTNGDTATGTGFLVGPCWVLTNAHCIYPLDKAGRPTYRTRSITVYPGRHGADEPFGGHDSNGWAVSRHWSSGREINCQFDYGMIRLRNDVGNKSFKRLANQPLRWWGAPGTNTFLTVADPATLAGSACMTAGYPYRRGVNELAARVMRRSDGNITGSANVAYCRDGDWRGRVTQVVDHQSRIVNHDADTERGQSGGPLWIAGRDNALLIAGIHQGFATWTGPAPQNAPVRTNIAVRFGREVLGQVNQWMDPRTWRAALSGVATP